MRDAIKGTWYHIFDMERGSDGTVYTGHAISANGEKAMLEAVEARIREGQGLDNILVIHGEEIHLEHVTELRLKPK